MTNEITKAVQNTITPEITESRKQQVKKNGKQGGFTLVEVIIVTVILGALAAMFIPSIMSGQGKANDNSGMAKALQEFIVTDAMKDKPSITPTSDLCQLIADPHTVRVVDTGTDCTANTEKKVMTAVSSATGTK